MKTDFHDKNVAPRLAFIMRFEATRKWSILRKQLNSHLVEIQIDLGLALKDTKLYFE